MTAAHALPEKPLNATRWSLFQQLQVAELAGESAEVSTLIDQVLAIYQKPLHNHLTRQLRLSPEDADDVLQEFLLAKRWLRDIINRADQGKGKFRSLLLTSLQNFVRDWWAKRATKKEAPNKLGVSDALTFFAANSACDAFDCDSARAMLCEAIIRFKQASKPERWRLFCRQILCHHLYGVPALSAKEAALEFGFQNHNQVDTALTNCKRMFRKCLNSVAAQFAADETEVECELAELARTLANADGQVLQLPLHIEKELLEICGTRPEEAPPYRTMLSELFALEVAIDATLNDSSNSFLQQAFSKFCIADSPECKLHGDWSVLQILTSKITSLPALRELKNVGRNWIESPSSSSASRQGAILYLTSIAAAELNGGERITKASNQQLRKGIDQLLLDEALPIALKLLLQDFGDRLRQ